MNWLGVFFAKIVAKAKTEAKSRTVIREVLEPQLTDLLGNINLIAEGIQAKTQKEILVFVDDTDKPLFDQATRLFKNDLAPLLEPNMHIVYTVPVWMCFTDVFPEIRDPWVTLLPNVKLYNRHSPSDIDTAGVATMEKFIHVRMAPALMDDDATRLVIMKSGGVYREAARVLQIAIDRAIEENRSVVSLDNVEMALQVLRRGYRRLITELTSDEIENLKAIGEDKGHQGGPRFGRFLNNLLVLEYNNGENWTDLPPLLSDVL